MCIGGAVGGERHVCTGAVGPQGRECGYAHTGIRIIHQSSQPGADASTIETRVIRIVRRECGHP